MQDNQEKPTKEYKKILFLFLVIVAIVIIVTSIVPSLIEDQGCNPTAECIKAKDDMQRAINERCLEKTDNDYDFCADIVFGK